MYKCPICIIVPWASDNRQKIIEHMKIYHKSTVRSGRCPINTCNKPFGDIYKYLAHVDKCHPEPIFDPSQNKRQTTLLNDQPCKKICINPPSSNVSFGNNESPCTEALDEDNVEQTISRGNYFNKAFDSQLLEFQKSLTEKTENVVKELYSNVSLSMKVIQQIINLFNDFQKKSIDELKKIEPHLFLNSRIDTALKFLQDSFHNINSQSKAFKQFNIKQTLIKPIPKLVDTRLKPLKKKNHGKTLWLPTNIYIQTIPMKSVLKKFLELPNVLNTIEKALETSDISYPITSFTQGKAWRQIKSQHESKFVIPLTIYFDDFEINNPMGSHKKKIGAVYYTISCLPDEFSGKLENWFLAQLHNEPDYARLGNKKIFGKFIFEILALQKSGINVLVSGVKRQIFFCIGRILGDNLGLNQILGFVRGFNTSNFCRICISGKTMKKIITDADKCILRNQKNYEEDLRIVETLKKEEHSHGVRERSVFEPVFNMFDSPSVDPLHDLQEGTGKRWLLKILYKLLSSREIDFTLKDLNEKIRLLNIDTNSGINIPSEFQDKWIDKEHIPLTGSEMSFVIEYLGILIGEYIPRGNNIWGIYILYRKIFFLIMAPSFSKETPNELDILIKKFYKKIDDLNLGHCIPKDHFLSHYPRAMEILGPLRYASSIRGEAVHRDRKRSANTAISRVNPLYTLALRFQLTLSKKFYDNKPMTNIVTFKIKKKILMKNLVEFKNFESTSPVKGDEEVELLSEAKYDGTLYKSGVNIIVEISNNMPVFGVIKYMIRTQDNIYFIVNKLHTSHLDDHIQAYVVEETATWLITQKHKLVTYMTFYSQSTYLPVSTDNINNRNTKQTKNVISRTFY